MPRWTWGVRRYDLSTLDDMMSHLTNYSLNKRADGFVKSGTGGDGPRPWEADAKGAPDVRDDGGTKRALTMSMSMYTDAHVHQT